MTGTEPFVLTGGGPGNTTTLLSLDLVKIALGQFDLAKKLAGPQTSQAHFIRSFVVDHDFHRPGLNHEEIVD